MQPPSHRLCLEQQSATDVRNRLYLHLIFDHSSVLCDTVYYNCAQDYVGAYEELVKKEGHGTPGSTFNFRVSVPVLHLPATERSEIVLRESSRIRLCRAEQLVSSWKKLQGPTSAFWEQQWQYGYRGFLDVQKELGTLRDDIAKGDLEGPTTYSLDYLRKKLNELLVESAREWYLKWGELDLHRLSFKDALGLIWRVFRQPAWREMRIVAGQRQHGGKHASEGVLFGLLQTVFAAEGEAEGLAAECRRFVQKNNLQVRFYSSGAAVWLRTQRMGRERKV